MNVIFNGLTVNALYPNESVYMYATPKVIGGAEEDCYSAAGGEWGYTGDGGIIDKSKTFYGAPTDEWTDTENLELYAAKVNKQFWCISNYQGVATSAPSIVVRNFVYASLLLTFDNTNNPPTTGLWWIYLQPTDPTTLGVFQEQSIVPWGPVKTQAPSIAGYATGGGYIREFAHCYYRQTDESQCVAMVNPSATTIPLPTATTTAYAHKVNIAGGGVFETPPTPFGTATPPTVLAPGTGVILFK
jgi:hypothetical protein